MAHVGYALEDLPRGRRGADRLAVALYEVLADHSEADRRYVLGKLRPGGMGAGSRVLDQMTDVLRLCESDIGRFPSYRAYEAWRLQQDAPGDWPSGSSIGRAFGSWATMLDRLEVEPVARPQARALRSYGGPLTRAEVLDAIERCAREVPERPLTFRSYRAWARAARQRDEHDRVPLAIKPFVRLFGGFAEAARLVGVEPNMQLRGAANRSWYTTEEIGAALRGASEALGDRAPSSRAYHQWRKALLAESRARGSRLSLPSDVAIYDHYPNWAAALHGAGLISDDEIAVVRRRISPVSRERVAAALLDFIGQSPTVTRTEYVRWRKRQPMHLGTRDAPDCWGMIKRFGTWPVLVEAARHALLSSDPQSELVRTLEEMER
jgi:hypothetical protein